MSKKQCIVIGGGFAGIAAAMHLAQQNLSVTMLEPRGFLGGRARSFIERETGDIIDNGQHLLMGCYTTTLGLLHTLGTSHLLKTQKSMKVDFVDRNSTVHRLNTSLLPGAAGMALGILMLSGLSYIDKWSAIRLALRVRQYHSKAGDMTVLEFLRKEKQTPRIIERFWEPVVLATLNAPLSDAAASLFVEVLRRAFLAGSRSSQLLFPAAGLSELLAPFPEWFMQHGGTLLQNSVEELLIENNTVWGVRTNEGVIFPADNIICAIPARMLHRLLPPDIRASGEFATLEQFHPSPIISVYLWFDSSFLDNEFFAMLGTDTQWIFNRRKLCDAPPEVRDRFPGHIALTISAGDALAALDAEEIVRHCLAEIRQAFPKAQAAQLLHSKVIKEKMATFRATPEVERCRPHATTSLGNFFLAGDWTNTHLPATIEGAAQSGVTAAREVCKAL